MIIGLAADRLKTSGPPSMVLERGGRRIRLPVLREPWSGPVIAGATAAACLGSAHLAEALIGAQWFRPAAVLVVFAGILGATAFRAWRQMTWLVHGREEIDFLTGFVRVTREDGKRGRVWLTAAADVREVAVERLSCATFRRLLGSRFVGRSPVCVRVRTREAAYCFGRGLPEDTAEFVADAVRMHVEDARRPTSTG
jgi:hypothetical protein